MQMTEKSIISMYRQSRNKSTQIGILAELNNTRKSRIIGILSRNGEKIPERDMRSLTNRMNRIEQKIKDLEAEYREICSDITGGETAETERG